MTTLMSGEIQEIPRAASRLLAGGSGTIDLAAEALRDLDPPMLATIARGSSDHACLFLKYAFELVAGLPVASIGPSVASIYGRELQLAGCAAIAISQSGKSPDIVGMAASARANGAFVVSLTNSPTSPLAEVSDVTIDIMAGEEKSVAATKSYVNSVLAGLMLIARTSGDKALEEAISGLPSQLEAAVSLEWSPALSEVLASSRSLYILGRGPSFAIAQELALKFKETCGLHAEAYSAAEVLHGPARIVGDGFPVIALSSGDEADASTAEVVDRLAGQGAQVFMTSTASHHAISLPTERRGDPVVDALALICPAYRFTEQLSRRLGNDPDRPPHLMKVTETR